MPKAISTSAAARLGVKASPSIRLPATTPNTGDRKVKAVTRVGG